MSTHPPPPAADARRLTDAFRRAGILTDGAVCDVVVESARATILSHITRLTLSYEAGSHEGGTSDAPASVILKTGHPDRKNATWNAGRQEVEFYSRIASLMPPGLVPRCFDAHCDPDTDAWHILLEDLSRSHVIATTWPLPPTLAHCERIVEARARFHAAWWNDARLGVSVGTWLDDAAMAQWLGRFAAAFSRFVDTVGDRLPRDRRDLFERLIAAAPRLLARYHTHRDLTLVHGDAHVWNCFLPRDAGSADVRFFDWDSWRIDTATDDLAYMIAVHWYPDLRRERERSLLDRYHATLALHGVGGYDRRALDDDYRASVLWQLVTPVFQSANDIPPLIWWNNLGRVLLAVDDLDCRALLG